MNVAVPPGATLVSSLSGPVPLAAHVEPLVAAHVHVIEPETAGGESLTNAPVTADGPTGLAATIVYVTEEPGTSVSDESVLVSLTLAVGTSASPAVAAGDTGPDDLAIAPLVVCEALLMVGRDGHPFRRRERRQLLAVGRIADQLAARY